MSDEYELPEYITLGITLTERHAAADRAIAYSLGVLESAIPLIDDGPAKTVMKTALAPLRQYENAAAQKEKKPA